MRSKEGFSNGGRSRKEVSMNRWALRGAGEGEKGSNPSGNTLGMGVLNRIVNFAFLALVICLVLPEAGPAAPGTTSFNVRATFAGAYGGKVSKIVGGPYTGKTTGGILSIGKKFGTLDLRFSPGSTPLTMSLDEEVDPGTCLADRPLPDSPLSVASLSVFTYKEAFLAEPCSEDVSVSGYDNSPASLNLLGMTDAQTAYVQIHLRFEVTGFPDYFVMRPNKTDVVEPEFVGIVKVTATDLNPSYVGVDHWEFTPMACPLWPVLQGDETNIYQTYPTGKRTSGSCSQGDYRVPFLLVLDRI